MFKFPEMQISKHCEAVHKDIVSKADSPFYSKCTQLIQRAYSFKTSNIKPSKKGFLGIGYSVTLSGIMKSVITAPILKKDININIKLQMEKPKPCQKKRKS